MIKGSDLPQSAKLTLIDLALNPDSYIDMLQETLSPVAEAFRQCRSLVEPLLEEFRRLLSGGRSHDAGATHVLRPIQNSNGRHLSQRCV